MRARGCWAWAFLVAARLAESVVGNKVATVLELEVASNGVLPEIAIGIDPLVGQGDSQSALAEEGGALPAEVRIAVDRGGDPGFDVVPRQAKTAGPPAVSRPSRQSRCSAC
jgi:hypothetical protein